MSKYLDMLPSNCEDKQQGIIRAVMVEDMLKNGTIFAEMERVSDDKFKYYLKETVSDILEVLYRSKEAMVVWNKHLERNASLFSFSEATNEKLLMLFPIKTPGFEQEFLKDIISVKGGKEMAKICPKTKGYVLYLDCKECKDRAECEER